jgi:hypothetical protein
LLQVCKRIALYGQYEVNQLKAADQLFKYMQLYDDKDTVNINLSEDVKKVLDRVWEAGKNSKVK